MKASASRTVEGLLDFELSWTPCKCTHTEQLDVQGGCEDHAGVANRPAPGLDTDDDGRALAGTALSPNDDGAWTEVPPSAADISALRLKHATAWLELRLSDGYFGAQLVVLRGSRVALDRSVGSTNQGQAKVTPHDRFIVYSLGKPFAALWANLRKPVRNT